MSSLTPGFSSSAGGAVYYRPGGACDPARFAAALPVVLAIVAVLAFVYAVVEVYIPIVGYVTAVLVVGFAYLIGRVVAEAFVRAHVRGKPLATATAVLVPAFALYCAWVVFIIVGMMRQGPVNAPLPQLFLHPIVIGRIIADMARRDPGQVIFWVAEAAVVVGFAAVVALRPVRSVPYCETCRAWCRQTGSTALARADENTLKGKMERGDFAHLADIGPARTDTPCFTQLNVYTCPICRQLNTLNAALVTRTRNRRGRVVNKARVFMRNLLIAPDAAENIRRFSQFMKTSRESAATETAPPIYAVSTPVSPQAEPDEPV